MIRTKKMIRQICLLLVMVMVISAVPAVDGVGTETVMAASTTKSKAIKAFKIFMAKKQINWNGRMIENGKENEFALIYLDKDDVPELVVRSYEPFHMEGFVMLYKYSNGKVRCMGGFGDGIKGYYKKKNIVDIFYEGGGAGANLHTICTVSGKKRITFLEYNDEIEYGYDTNGNGKLDIEYESVDKKGNYKTISKKKFNTLLKKKVGKTKLTKVKFRSNTKSNRNKYMK